MSKSQFVDFLNMYQRDPRLNEILYPFVTLQDAQRLIERYEPSQENKTQGLLSYAVRSL